jgi:hypothetical protein
MRFTKAERLSSITMPVAFSFDVQVRVAAFDGDSGFFEPQPHLGPPGYDRGGPVAPLMHISRRNCLNFELARSNQLHQRCFRYLSSPHHLNQDKIVGEQPLQRLAVSIGQRFEEFTVRRERA